MPIIKIKFSSSDKSGSYIEIDGRTRVCQSLDIQLRIHNELHVIADVFRQSETTGWSFDKDEKGKMIVDQIHAVYPLDEVELTLEAE